MSEPHTYLRRKAWNLWGFGWSQKRRGSARGTWCQGVSSIVGFCVSRRCWDESAFAEEYRIRRSSLPGSWCELKQAEPRNPSVELLMWLRRCISKELQRKYVTPNETVTSFSRSCLCHPIELCDHQFYRQFLHGLFSVYPDIRPCKQMPIKESSSSSRYRRRISFARIQAIAHLYKRKRKQIIFALSVPRRTMLRPQRCNPGQAHKKSLNKVFSIFQVIGCPSNLPTDHVRGTLEEVVKRFSPNLRTSSGGSTRTLWKPKYSHPAHAPA